MAAQPGPAGPDEPAPDHAVSAARGATVTSSGETVTPLAVAQEALWYRAVMAPTALTYNEAISIRKDGPLDGEALRLAFNEIVRRHTAWRTTFDAVGGEPVQVVGPPLTFELPVLDLSGLSRDQAERRATDMVAETARVPYDLRRGPLLRPRLVRFDPSHHRLYLAMHHLIFDGLSLTRIVLPELATLYEAFCHGRPDPPLDAPLAYAEYARWGQASMHEPRVERRLAYWERRFNGAPRLSLALDHERPSASMSHGGAVALEVAPETVERLRDIGRAAGATLFQVLAAAWALLLAAHAGQEDVVFAVAADTRYRPELQNVVGCAVTPLALRLDLSGDPSVSELVLRVRNELLDGLDNIVTFERLVRALDADADAAGANPIYQTMLVLEPATVNSDPAWSVHQIDAPLADAVGACKVDLELQLDERPPGGLAGQLIYDRDLFEEATAGRFRDHWLRLLDLVAAATPSLPISRLAMLTPAEEQRQLSEVNATRTELRRAPLHELVSERARRQPNAIAVRDRALRISYAELDRWSDPTPADLSDIDEPGAHVVVDALRALKRGARLQIPATGGWSVEITHEAALNGAIALGAGLAITSSDTVLVLPRTLVRDPIAALWMGLAAGARIVLASPDAAGNGARLRRLIRAEEVTFLQASPDEWQSLIDSGLRSVRGLRALSLADRGSALSRELAGRLLARCRVLWNAYGTAETSGYGTLGRVEIGGPVTIGRPLTNTRAYVVDRHDRPVPIDVVGELLIAGEGVAAGYLDADAPDGRFVADPFGPGRAFRTGQRVRRRPDGRLEQLSGP
jgi:non-ribosomal peptide synthetase component F